jgi:serine/threonine-protein kinase
MNGDESVTGDFEVSGGPPIVHCVVPKLKGKTLKAATRTLKAHFCSLGKVSHSFSRTVKKGRVISQKPRPGKRLKARTKVSLVLSKGKR